MKRLFSLFLAFFFLLTLQGEVAFADEAIVERAQTEENAFRVVRSVDEEISLTYIFPSNTQIFLQLGYSETQIKHFRFYLSIYIAALATQNRERATDGVEVGQVNYFGEVDGIGFSIVFDDLNAQQNFFGGDENSSSSDVKESGFFMKKTEIFVDFPISKTSADNMKKIFSFAVTSWAESEGISDTSDILSALEEAVFVYEFDTSDDILLSDNMQVDETIRHFLFRNMTAWKSKFLSMSSPPTRQFGMLLLFFSQFFPCFWRISFSARGLKSDEKTGKKSQFVCRTDLGTKSLSTNKKKWTRFVQLHSQLCSALQKCDKSAFFCSMIIH